MKKTFFISMLSLCLMFCGCTANRKIIDVSQGNTIGMNEKQESNRSDETGLYRDICNSIENNESEFTLKNIPEEDIVDTYQTVIREHPEYFWLSEGYSFEKVDDGTNITIIFKPLYSSNLNVKKELFNDVVNNIVDSIDSAMNAYDKILYIHDYIIDSTEYDNNTAQEIGSGNTADIIYNASTAYGCLVDKKAICSGYSAAFQLLANRLGFECGRVSGAKKDGVSHEWNYIKIEDEYYFMDVTWDDPVNEGTISNKCYDFYCITEDELEETHEIEKNQNIPKCNSTKYNYYIYNDSYVEKYSFEAVKKVFDNTSNKNMTVKFSSKKECEAATDDLIKNNRLFEIVDSSNINYSIGASGKTLTVY